MLIKKPDDVSGSEITPESVYVNRRAIVRAGVVAASVLASGWVYRRFNSAARRTVAVELPPLIETTSAKAPATAATTSVAPATAAVEEVVDPAIAKAFTTDEPRTPYQDVTNYNNFYEFSSDKEGVAPAARGFVTRPWTIEVSGLARKPRTFDVDEILSLAPAEERVYRMRCVEAWSMVIPWNGFSLSKLLERVEPLSNAKYVAFTTLFDPKRMPNQRAKLLDWPYVEGLRMDEAMHPLTILASGLYGRQIPGQNGAPLRLVVPWKYGFKGIKSIVKIELTEKEPATTWNLFAPREYGFYANVNPQVDHPRWSQASERRIGDSRRRDTLMFNGYGEQVADLYAGMDLGVNF